MDSALEGWTDFNVAVAGATAALAGLIIVAMSVNITEILKGPSLPARAAAAIAALVLALVSTCFGLFPDQPVQVLGLEVLGGTVVAAVIQIVAIRRIVANQPRMSWRVSQSVGVLPLIGFATGSVLLVAGSPAGYYAVAAGCIGAIIVGILVGWVVLVEILR